MAGKRRNVVQLTEKPVSRRRRPTGRFAPATQAQVNQLDLGGLNQVLGVMLRLAQVASFEVYRALAAASGVTPVQFSILRLVAANPGINQTVLAQALGADPSRMVFIIDELEGRGLVQRLASTVDRRSRAIFLTAEGRKLDRALVKNVARQNKLLIERLRGDDPAALLRMLGNLIHPV